MQIGTDEDYSMSLSEIYVGISLRAAKVKLFAVERDGTFELRVSSTKETKRYIVNGANIELVPEEEKPTEQKGLCNKNTGMSHTI